MANDPARAKKRTMQETREAMRQVCRELPCLPYTSGRIPPCVTCVHEGKLIKKEEK